MLQCWFMKCLWCPLPLTNLEYNRIYLSPVHKSDLCECVCACVSVQTSARESASVNCKAQYLSPYLFPGESSLCHYGVKTAFVYVSK